MHVILGGTTKNNIEINDMVDANQDMIFENENLPSYFARLSMTEQQEPALVIFSYDEAYEPLYAKVLDSNTEYNVSDFPKAVIDDFWKECETVFLDENEKLLAEQRKANVEIAEQQTNDDTPASEADYDFDADFDAYYEEFQTAQRLYFQKLEDIQEHGELLAEQSHDSYCGTFDFSNIDSLYKYEDAYYITNTDFNYSHEDSEPNYGCTFAEVDYDRAKEFVKETLAANEVVEHYNEQGKIISGENNTVTPAGKAEFGFEEEVEKKNKTTVER